MQKYRQAAYSRLQKKAKLGILSLVEVMNVAYKILARSKVHPHFFASNSLRELANYLCFFALKLPHNYKEPEYLSKKINAIELQQILTLLERRAVERIPTEYITNEAYYLGNKFYVNEHVLVPRSIMSNRFKRFLHDISWHNYRVLDLCTGSGCIGISLALLKEDILVDLVDVSEQALAVAKINIDRFKLNNRVKCVQSDLFSELDAKYDLIITNPPYVAVKDYVKAPLEFKNEPKIALEAGEDGLDIISRILVSAGAYLNPHGSLIAEVGFDTAKKLKKLYPQGLKWFRYLPANGREPLFGMDGVFLCQASFLQMLLKTKKMAIS